MNFLAKIIGYLISFPARSKGMKFGKNSFIAPGYDFLFEQLKNIRLGRDVSIGKSAWIHTIGTGEIKIGANTKIGRRVTIAALEKISIGDGCLFSYDVSILDHDHDFQESSSSPTKSGLSEAKTVTIGKNCFIGAHSFVLKGVTLGDHCVVGANCVVTKSFPGHSIIVGNPGKLVQKNV